MTASPSGPHSEVGDREDLGVLGQLLLTTDGTLTPMLELVVGEPIVTSSLARTHRLADPMESAEFLTSGMIMCRSARLVGVRSGTVYVEAESAIRMEALPPAFRSDLVETGEPIGRLLHCHRLETFREILTWEVHRSDFLGRASRRYRVDVGGAPAFLIKEIFSADCFRARHGSQLRPYQDTGDSDVAAVVPNASAGPPGDVVPYDVPAWGMGR